MSDGVKSGPRSIDRRTAGRAAGAIGLMVILAAILGPTALMTHPPSATPGATQVAADPSSSHPTPTEAGPTAEPEPWDDLDVPPFQATAALEPNDRDRLGVATGSTFTLRSLTATPAVELARGLRTDPPIKLAIAPGATADVAVIRPAGPLTEGIRYRFRLDAPDGALAGSWAFTTRSPLNIVGTLPDDKTADVPANTGIEITFDQDGTSGVAEHFSIVPAVTGRFEQHDRTWAFVPDKPLALATIYTVTVTPGVGITGSSETLETGRSFRFETAATTTDRGPRSSFGRPMFEARPGERAAIPLGYEVYDDEESGASSPDSLTVDIHRLAGFSSVVDAAITLAGPDSWAFSSPAAIVDTSGLALVARVEGAVLDSGAGAVLRLPFRPDAGSYIVTIVQAGPPAQMLLQVTNLAAYALTAEKTSVVWVNDLATGGVVSGATISVAKGAGLGATDHDGVLRIATPSALMSDAVPGEAGSPRFLTVRAADGRRLVVPVGLPTSLYDYDGWYGWRDSSAEWWLVLQSDRTTFRQTDTVNVYGMIRARSDRSVPGGLELRLRPVDGPIEAPIQRIPIRANQRGVFTASMRFEDLPRASYSIDLFVGKAQVSSVWIQVSEIRKPAYQIDVTTDRHVYVLGQQIQMSAVASFYDGTPVPGLDLRFSAFDQGATVTSGALGEATAKLRAASSYTPEGWFGDSVGVHPAHPEEGQIDGSTGIVLLPSRAWLTGTGTVTAERVIVRGTLTWADIRGLEAKLDAGDELDYENDGPGRPIADGTIRARVVHYVPVKHQVGTVYDFIEKRVVPVYEGDIEEVVLGTQTLTSAADGTFRLSIPAPVPTDDYLVTLTTTDPEGRRFERTVYVSPPFTDDGTRQPYLEVQGSCGYSPPVVAGLDEALTVTMREGTGRVASGGRFLFLVSEQGSMETTVQDAAAFSRTLRDADLPGFTVRAVWLSGGGYAIADASAVVDPDDKRLTIRLLPDRAKYQPGQHVTMAVRTLDPSGNPVAADVVVQGVDQKLYTTGAAYDTDPVRTLMSGTSAGFLDSYATHAAPVSDGDGCGATGGGRDDFRDVITFQHVTTGSDGRGTAEFDLSDDLTSWHMTATGFTAGLDSGVSSVLIPVGLPFFVDAILAPEYLVGEEPVLRLRAFGGALAAGDRVRFSVEAPSLGLGETAVSGTAFQAVRVPLPAVVGGDHAIRIAATWSHDGKVSRDALVRTIHVATSRLSGLIASYDVLEPGFEPQGGDGLTTYSITDAGRGRLLSLLQELAWTDSARFDKLAAADLARQLLVEEFGFSPNALPSTSFDASRYARQGIALLPYSSSDLFLTALAALAAPTMLSQEELREALSEGAFADEVTRERTIVSLAGLAGLGDDVLEQLRAYDPAELTVREQLWLALGFAAAGDEEAARAIERSVLEAAGQRLGPWVRLAAGTTLDNTLEASGLLLVLASRLGDPLSHEVSTYLAQVHSLQRVFPLEQVAYVTGMLERLSPAHGRFAWTVAGDRHEEELPLGGTYTLVLTSEQRATLALERLDGELGIVTSYTSDDAPLPTSSTISITRTIAPFNNAPDDRLVRVRLSVGFGAQSAPGCYRLTDLTPSGLSAVTSTAGWPDGDEAETNRPYEVDGQRVSWCASPGDRSHEYVYSARVVSPGTYLWEPTILQFELAPGVGAATAGASYTIQ